MYVNITALARDLRYVLGLGTKEVPIGERLIDFKTWNPFECTIFLQVDLFSRLYSFCTFPCWVWKFESKARMTCGAIT